MTKIAPITMMGKKQTPQEKQSPITEYPFSYKKYAVNKTISGVGGAAIFGLMAAGIAKISKSANVAKVGLLTGGTLLALSMLSKVAGGLKKSYIIDKQKFELAQVKIQKAKTHFQQELAVQEAKEA